MENKTRLESALMELRDKTNEWLDKQDGDAEAQLLELNKLINIALEDYKTIKQRTTDLASQLVSVYNTLGVFESYISFSNLLDYLKKDDPVSARIILSETCDIVAPALGDLKKDVDNIAYSLFGLHDPEEGEE